MTTSPFQMVAEREAGAVAADDRRTQIARLSEQLAAVEDELSRLEITRSTALPLGYTEAGSRRRDRRRHRPARLPADPEGTLGTGTTD
ncbi:hypothetical protein ACWGKQ_01765 [Streptomyces sp. NPDC054770]